MAYNTDQKPGESVEHWYRRLAKTADQRLVRLESYSHDEYFSTATQWAYAKAQKDIGKWSGPEATRFNTNPPKNNEDMIAKINDMRSFLEAPSSTKKGIIDIYKKRADTFNKGRINEKGEKKGGFGTEFTWQDIAQYYESGLAQKWTDKFGSETALKTIAVIQKNRKKIAKAIKQNKEVFIRVPSNEILQETVNKALKDQNLSVESLL